MFFCFVFVFVFVFLTKAPECTSSFLFFFLFFFWGGGGGWVERKIKWNRISEFELKSSCPPFPEQIRNKTPVDVNAGG